MAMDASVFQDLFVQMIEQGLELGYLKGVLKTLDRSAYLTDDYVHDAIKACMDAHGRVSAGELSSKLNLDQHDIIHAWSVLAPTENWTILDDVLLSKSYIDSMQEEFQSKLDASGLISMVQLTQHWSLPYNFIREILDSLVDKDTRYIKYPALPDLVLTKTHTDDLRKQISSALDESSEPLSLHKLQRRTLESQEDLFYVILEDIIDKDMVQGIFRGRREKAVFIPHSYREHQLSLIFSLMEAAGYIEYETVERHYAYANPKDLLTKQHPNILLLDTCAMTQSLLDRMLIQVEQHIDTDPGWADMARHVPSTFTSADTAAVLDMIFARLARKTKANAQRPRRRKQAGSSDNTDRNKQPIILGTRFITTTEFLQSLVASAQPFLEQRAIQAIQQEKKLHSAKVKKRLQGEREIRLEDEEICDYLVGTGLDAAFGAQAAPVIRRPMIERLQNAIRSVYVPSTRTSSTDDDWRLQQIERERALLSDIGRRTYLTYKSIMLFQDESAKKSLEKYLVRHFGCDLLYHWVMLRELEHSTDQDSFLLGLQLTSKEIQEPSLVSEEKKKAVIDMFVKDHQQDMAELYEITFNGKKAGPLVKFLTESPPPIFQDILDESHQDKTKQQIKLSLSEQLKRTDIQYESAPSILHLTSLLYFQSLYHLPLYVSGKFVPHILKQIATVPDVDNVQTLVDAQTMILGSRKTPESFNADLIRKVREMGLQILDSRG